MQKLYPFLVIIFLVGCNPTLTQFRIIYVDEGPNKKIAERAEKLLEESFYNVDIVLQEGVSSVGNIDSLRENRSDIAIIENYVDDFQGVSSAFSIYTEVIHIFYKKELKINSFEELVDGQSMYIGKENTPSYNLMMDLFDFYGLDQEGVSITFDMSEADVVVILTNLLSQEELSSFSDYQLFSFDAADRIGQGSIIDGIALKYPRLEPFVIPQHAYWEFTPTPVATLAIEIIMVVRATMGNTPVNDFTKTMLQNRQLFAPIDPLLYNGMKEDFDRSRLNIPLHEGARVYLDRDEPGFFERYAELAGVILSIVIALGSGLVSLTRWQAQKKKDRIDEFYEELLSVKNGISDIRNAQSALQGIKRIQLAQNRAFELLISEELVANDSFRIYMELSKETINELKTRIQSINRQSKTKTS